MVYYNHKEGRKPYKPERKEKMRNFFRNFDFDPIYIPLAVIVLCQIAIIISAIMMAITK